MARLYVFAAVVVCSVLLVPCSGSKSYALDSSESISSSEDFQQTTSDENDSGECEDEDYAITCGVNEVLNNCPSNCRRDYCPKNEADSKATCTTPKSCPKPACKCRFNYRRAANGTCIPTTECPKFHCHGRNEIYNPCPPFCPSDSCSQATPTGRCPLPGRIGITLECNPKCRCKPGFWRRNGICVPYGQCPNVCPANEVYSECIEGACKALNCTQKGQDVLCSNNGNSTCTKGCICKDNFLRNENGTCIPEDECQTTELQCNDGEVVDNCPSDCPADYCPQTDEEAQVTSCPQPDPCPEPACKCGFNRKRAANGSCIAASDCSPIDCSDGPNQEFVACPPFCSDSCSQATPTGDCPKTIGHIGIVVPCQPKCRCIKHYFRNDTGTCVPYGECPGVCGKNEVYSDCRNTCPPQICKSIVSRYPCPRQPPPDCTAGCVCQSGFFKNNLNDTDCIPACECPELANASDCLKTAANTT